MATKRQIKVWCNGKVAEFEAALREAIAGNQSISTEDLHKIIAKGQILKELLTYIETPDEP